MKNNIPSIGTARRSIFDFLTAWIRADYEKMFELCQLSWKRHDANNREWVTKYFSQMKLHSFELKKQTGDGAMVTVYGKAKITYMQHDKAHKLTTHPYFQVNTICESGALKPDLEGIWGVNPNSMKVYVQQKTAEPGDEETPEVKEEIT